jgi:5-methylthioadenosine/S-adenosylhomocysteine deaminase
MSKKLIKNGYIITNNPVAPIFKGDILIENDKIQAIDISITADDAYTIDATERYVSPGFIQPHTHLTQTLFRGQADDLELMDFLKNRIWKFEASHTEETNYISAKLGIAELIKSGTTTILDMGTVNHQESIFEAIYETGIRAISGKCMMDFGEGVPNKLMETTDQSIAESTRLLKKWHGKDNYRIKYAFAPRFAISCTDDLFKQVNVLAKEHNVLIHTHASENKGEIELVMNLKGKRNLEYFHNLGVTGQNLVLAHCVWLDADEIEIIKDTGTKIVHCPNSNMKLASGIAKIPELINNGINVSLAYDSASCNNSLSIFNEMKSCALLHKANILSPTTMNAKTVFDMATIDGAKTINEDRKIGTIEIGKQADIIILNLNTIETLPINKKEPFSSIVYSASSQNVETVIIDGKIVMQDKKITTINEEALIKDVIRNANHFNV